MTPQETVPTHNNCIIDFFLKPGRRMDTYCLFREVCRGFLIKFENVYADRHKMKSIEIGKKFHFTAYF